MKQLLTITLALGLSTILMANEPTTAPKTEVKTSKMSEHGIVTKQSAVDVNTTMNRLEALVSKKGANVFNRINHQANAKKAGGVDMDEAQLLIFGKPKVGLKMMTKDPKAGLDLPLKMLVYKAKDGQVYISYRDVAFYEKIYNLKGCKVHYKMSKFLDMLSNKVTLSQKEFDAFLATKAKK